MDRIQHEKQLRKIFGFEKFLDDQWKTIERLLKGERVLLIERTGYGKSLCYQYPATAFKGTTIVFSPLIALMRDQVNFAQSKGIPVAAIHSNLSDAEIRVITNEAVKGKFKIIFIAPERQENIVWINAASRMNISMVVIDEAHCISVWGHDFRPSYRKIINLINLLPKNFPVLAATATATPRVEEDIKKQIGKNVLSIRGKLVRHNLNLRVIKVKSEDEKMIWLGRYLNKLPGTGIIYTGTRVSTEQYCRWFEYLNLNIAQYNGGLDAATRNYVETGLMNNSFKCVVSTNALGMGIDKADIRFIIHTQMPESPIHYYQEIGRGGRDGNPSEIILFYNPEEDLDLLHSFIDSTKPPLSKYKRIAEIVRSKILGLNDIVKAANMKQTDVKVILADLVEQSILNEVMIGSRKKYEYRFAAPSLNIKKFEELRNHKLKELDDIIEYTETKKCRMKYLCDYLGDTMPGNCGRCDNDTGKKVTVNVTPEWEQKLAGFKGNYFPVLDTSQKNSKLVNGIAAGYYGFSNLGGIIHRCKYEDGGDFPEHLVELTLKAFKKAFGRKNFDLCLFVPPTESGNLVKNFAQKISAIIDIPFSDDLLKKRVTEPQKVFQTGHLKRENVNGAFFLRKPELARGKDILLIDDIYDSGSTIKEIGKYLTGCGAEKIAPLVIAKTVGGDVCNEN